jgi:site-specific recombinase
MGLVDPELASAIRTLAHHAGSLGLQPEFVRRLPHLENPESAFLTLTDRIFAYIRSYTNGIEGDEPELLEKAYENINLCRAEVEHLRATKHEQGTSLRLTGLTFRLRQLLDRLELLLKLTDKRSGCFQSCAITLFKQIASAEKTRNHVLPLLRDRADLLAFQVVEHAAKKGGKYITSGRRDYASFFMASLGGGALVAIFSFLKVSLGDVSLPLGVRALLYGLNYSLCFVIIYFTGAALATKQPALTANTIARALGSRENHHLEKLEDLVVRVWRSQFISFVGNLAMALPIAFAISELYFQGSGETIANNEKATAMMAALHPWHSGTVFFAAIAGFFLYAAGLVSGWVDNRSLYSRLNQRVSHHPTLVRLVGDGRASRFAGFLDRNLGVVAGNVFLGFALGSTGVVGDILGLPLDIRHIAFASAEFGTALEILHFDVAFSTLWPVTLGVILIGLINFLVSFGLSLVTALESRRITWRETTTLASHLFRRFRRNPLEWFFPPKSGLPVSEQLPS